MVTVTPPVPVTVDLAGDGKFFLVTPSSAFTPDASGNVTIAVTANYLTNLQRDGLKLSGGSVGGSVTGSFTFALRPSDAYPLALPIPTQPGDPAGTLEVSRLSLPYPTILPSYNQIGFDQLHYLIGLVEGTSAKAIAWMAGAMLPEGQTTTVIDPTTKTLLPLVVTYQAGLYTLANTAGLTVNVQNVNIPLSTFRISAHLAADGTATEGAHISGSTICGQIPTYGTFLEQLGFCNPQKDVLTVLGGANLAPYGATAAMAPSGVGSVAFSATANAVTATITGATISASDHVFSVLLVDATTGDPVTLSYGLATTHAPASGPIAMVSVPIQGMIPKTLRVYLMVDTYPAARGMVTLP
jgi:hypothetical protein